MTRKTISLAAAVLAAVAPAGACLAQVRIGPRFDWSLTTGAEYSDNIGRTRVNEESDTVGSAGLELDLQSHRPRLSTNIAANLRFEHYFEDTFGDRLVGGLDGALEYRFVPDRFSWIVQDNFGQIREDRISPDSPANRQNVNYFTTGPDLNLPLGDRTTAKISGRFSDTYFEDTVEDSRGLLGNIALVRSTSEQTFWSLNGVVNDISYDDDEIADSRIDEGFVRFETERTRTTAAVDLGATRVKHEGDSSGGLLARIEVTRKITSRSVLTLAGGREFESTGDVLRRDQSLGGVGVDNEDALASDDVFRSDYVLLRLDSQRDRSAIGIYVTGRREEHERRALLDRDIYGASVSLNRRVTRRVSTDLAFVYTREDFVNIDTDFDEWSARLGVDWRLTDRIGLVLVLSRAEGSGDDGFRDYTENRAYLGMRISRGVSR